MELASYMKKVASNATLYNELSFTKQRIRNKWLFPLSGPFPCKPSFMYDETLDKEVGQEQ
ncbi:hypothetical protein Avbf_11898 [Armadillidium vulgare]|nr:hypothetical protein Avbf_11898 [Armadillidium vulgare]